MQLSFQALTRIGNKTLRVAIFAIHIITSHGQKVKSILDYEGRWWFYTPFCKWSFSSFRSCERGKGVKKADTPLTDIMVGNCVRKGNELSHDCHDSCHEI